MTIVKNKEMEQRRNIDSSNKYIIDTLHKPRSIVSMVSVIKNRGEHQADAPFFQTMEAIGKTLEVLEHKLTAVNADTTKTEDAVTLEQSNLMDYHIGEAKSILGNGVGRLNTAIHATEATLFSRSADTSPEILAMLGNDTILQEMRKDYLSFADNERTATLLNTFNKYGVMGGKETQEAVSNSLDRRHSKEALARIKELNENKEGLKNMEEALTTAHQLLTRDMGKIVAIRARKFE